MKYIVKNETEWHALRAQYVTASNAATLVGADPYSSPAKLRKPEPFFGNAFTKVGQALEPVVVHVVNDVLGSSFKLFETADGSKEFYTCGHLGATPDAYMNINNGQMLLECKTTRPTTYIKYGSVPPSKYLIQLMVQMVCVESQSDHGFLAIMSTNLTQRSSSLEWPIKIFKVWTDDRISVILKEQAERFADTSKTFRVDSKVKQRVRLLLSMCYQEISVF